MNSKELLLMAKLGKKNPSLSANMEAQKVELPTADIEGSAPKMPTVKEGPIGKLPTANTGGSLELLKTTKITDAPNLKAKTGGQLPHPSAHVGPSLKGEVELGETKVYSPIKDYLKKKGK